MGVRVAVRVAVAVRVFADVMGGGVVATSSVYLAPREAQSTGEDVSAVVCLASADVDADADVDVAVDVAVAVFAAVAVAVAVAVDVPVLAAAMGDVAGLSHTSVANVTVERDDMAVSDVRGREGEEERDVGREGEDETE